MVKKIKTQKGREIYSQRIGIVEPVSANIRVHKRLDKFNLRGKMFRNVKTAFPTVSQQTGFSNENDRWLIIFNQEYLI